jgi:hypothetical protein
MPFLSLEVPTIFQKFLGLPVEVMSISWNKFLLLTTGCSQDDPETVMLATETGVLIIADTETEVLLHGEVKSKSHAAISLFSVLI